MTSPQQGEQRRIKASRALDAEWPAKRGEEVSGDAALAAAWRITGSNPATRHDRAGQRATLSDLTTGGLLEQVPSGTAFPSWRRPLVDWDFAAHAATQKRNAITAMFTPADGSEPIPYADYLAQQEARRNAPAPAATPTLEEKFFDLQQRYAALERRFTELEANQQKTTDRKERRWRA